MVLPLKRPLAVGLLIVRRVELLLAEVEADDDLVPALDFREVVGNLIVVDVEVSRSAGSASHVEVVADGDLDVVVRHVIGKRSAHRVLDAEVVAVRIDWRPIRGCRRGGRKWRGRSSIWWA